MGLRYYLLSFCLAFPAIAQLAPEQKLLDFQELAANFSKRYAFVEWKQDAIKWDSLNLAPWLTRVSASQSDLEFFEICAEYVAKNQDGHTAFLLNSDFEAWLGFDTDLYDGKYLIDWIDRKTLPAVAYPMAVGDELVSIDGVAPAELAAKFAVFLGSGNARAVRRSAAGMLTDRVQFLLPRAHEVGDAASVVIRRQNGDVVVYSMQWNKAGTPYLQAGPVPVPKTKAAEPTAPPYMRHVMGFQDLKLARSRFSIGVDTLKPAFTLPSSFGQRLGSGKYDSLYSGSYIANGKSIGFLRIPDFEYVSSTDLANEIKFFQNTTDGLVIDIMRNPGGSGCTVEGVMSYLNPGGYHSLGNKIRATWDLVMNLHYDLEDAAYYGATDDDIATLNQWLRQVERAYSESRGFTTPLPLCGNSLDIPAAKDKAGNEIAYTKPIVVLTDELSGSAAEVFAAVMQDEKRGLLYGMRTNGAGASVNQTAVGVYMEAYLDYAQSILVRKNEVDTAGEFPTAPYLENIGARPEIVDDYMTAENLLNQGKPFVDRFTQAILDRIGGK